MSAPWVGDSIRAAIAKAGRIGGESAPAALLAEVDALAESAGDVVGLPIVICEATRGDPTQAVPVAAAWLCLYYAAHLFDDVEDGAVGDPALHGRQVNHGTMLIFMAQRLLLSAGEGLPGGQAKALNQAFTEASLRVCLAQEADLRAGPDEALDLDAYWRIARGKGGEPMALACRAGALLGHQPAGEIDKYAAYGYHLGTLLQLADDLRAIWRPANPADTATVARTLPVAYAFAVSGPAERKRLAGLLRDAPQDPVALAALQDFLGPGWPRGAGDGGSASGPAGSPAHYLTLQALRERQLAREALFSCVYPSPTHSELMRLLDRIFPALPAVVARRTS